MILDINERVERVEGDEEEERGGGGGGGGGGVGGGGVGGGTTKWSGWMDEFEMMNDNE